MTKNESFFLLAFLLLIATLAAIIFSTSILGKINTAKKSIERYEKSLKTDNSISEEIKSLENQILELQYTSKKTSLSTVLNLTDMTSSIRAKLGRAGIKPIKVAVSGSEGNETVEFILKCNPSSFIRFLADANQPGGDYSYSSIIIRQAHEQDTLDISIRITNEK